MVKKITYILSTLMMCACVLLVPSIDSKAADVFHYDMPYAEPTTSVNSGYISVLLAAHGETNPDNWFPYVFQWNVMPENDTSSVSSSSMCLNIQKDGRIYFSANQGQTQLTTITVFCMTDNGAYHVLWTDISADDTWGRSVDYSSGFDIVGYKVFGNYGAVSDDFSYGENIAYNISWSTDDLLHQYLISMYIEQVQSNKNDSAMISKLTEIFNSVDSVENKLDELKEIQNQTNTWLEKIFDWLNESKEEERQEVTTQGGNSVSQGSDAIQNSGQGFGDSLGGLVSSMSYAGTDCSWTFPEVKIPAIKGVMNETVLIEQQPINFGVWIDAVPSNIMLLIRSVLTGALIIYCFKELYGTISYVLTLKGSGVNE